MYAALADIEGYPRWWPQVRDVHRIDADTGRVRIRSLLPYALDLVLHRAVQDKPRGLLRVEIDGDLQGWCEWKVTADVAGARADFSQEVDIRATLLQRAPLAVQPLLRGNYAYLMRSGERGLGGLLAGPGS